MVAQGGADITVGQGTMNHYYQDDHVIIYHGDARDMDEWRTADVLITDPPYGMLYRSNRGSIVHGTDPIAGDNNIKLRDTILTAWGDRPALVFGTWRVERPATTRHLLIWSKGDDPGMGDLGLPWGNSCEEIYVIGEGWHGKRGSNVLTFNTVANNSVERAHPTPKPLPLLIQLIRHSPPGVIADPFMGSGTTLRAAKDLGRKAIGVEVDERYCELAARRMGQEVLF